MTRRPGWLAQPPVAAGTALLLGAGGAIGWRVHHLPGAAAGALVGLLIAAVLVAVLGPG